MKPILVVVHIYYPELWEELKGCLKNITHPYELYVTTVRENEFLKKDILDFNPKTYFEVLENRGYDIGPFVHILNQVHLDDYSYVVKLHTKRDLDEMALEFRGLNCSKWRNALLSFIKTPENFNHCLQVFDENPVVGMLSNEKVIVYHDFYDKLAQKGVKKYLKENHLPYQKYAFVAGTMFIVRSFLLKDFQDLKISLSDFPMSGENHQSQLAHILERLMGYFVYKNGCIISDPVMPIRKYGITVYMIENIIKPLVHFIYQQKRTSSGYLLVKICKIPVYRRKV